MTYYYCGKILCKIFTFWKDFFVSQLRHCRRGLQEPHKVIMEEVSLNTRTVLISWEKPDCHLQPVGQL